MLLRGVVMVCSCGTGEQGSVGARCNTRRASTVCNLTTGKSLAEQGITRCSCGTLGSNELAARVGPVDGAGGWRRRQRLQPSRARVCGRGTARQANAVCDVCDGVTSAHRYLFIKGHTFGLMKYMLLRTKRPRHTAVFLLFCCSAGAWREVISDLHAFLPIGFVDDLVHTNCTDHHMPLAMGTYCMV